MKKMETSEAVDEYESCRSSVISDLEELEANLYSYVHHERNSCFGKEDTMVFNVSSLEEVCQQNEILVESENFGHKSLSVTNVGLKSLETKGNSSKSSEVDSACFVAPNDCDSSCYVQSSDVFSTQLSGERAKVVSGICVQSRESSPSVLEVNLCVDGNAAEKSLSKYRMPAVSTPVKEYVVIDDSDEEVQIELERIKIKPNKKKKRKKSEITEDIRLNTRSNSELVCLDLDEDVIFSEKENVDSLLCGQDHDKSEHKGTPCKSWTPQMAQFYDEPWGEDYINVSELQKTMSDDGWKVDMADEFYSLTSKFQNRRYFGVKSKAWCTKCNQKGHYRNNCTEKTSPPRCHRCGSSRHQEYSCNQKICLTCGRVRPSLVAVCQQCRQHSWKKCYICQQSGHPPGCCPDLWRRFHATILPGEIVVPQKVLYKDPKNTYCCNCASRGHHVYQCKKDNFSDYTPMNPKVISYEDPEVLFKIHNTCSHTSTNWDSVGAVAPECQNEGRGNPSFMDRGIKRPKTSGNKQKSKLRKLSENTAPKPTDVEIVPQKLSKKCGKPIKNNEIKKSLAHKIKEGLKPEKGFCKQDKGVSSVDNENHPVSKLEKAIMQNDVSSVKGPQAKVGIKEKETTDIDRKTGFMERIIVLSPGHLKRIESKEGKEILKYVTDQFKGVTARVVSDPSGVLRLTGTGNNIERFKANLFDVLNNKYGLDQLKQSIYNTGDKIQVKKSTKRAHTAVVRSKDVKKKFKNGGHQNNIPEGRSKAQGTIALSNSGDIQVKKGSSRSKIKKKPNAVHRLKCTLKKGNGNKFNNQGKQHNRQSALHNDRGDHAKIRGDCDQVVNHTTNTRQIFSNEMSKSSKYKGGTCEIMYNVHQVNEDMAHAGIAGPGSSHSKRHFSLNRKKCTKRNKNRVNGDLNKDKLRTIKLNNGKNGINKFNNPTRNFQQILANDLDKLGLMKVEVGLNRKVSFLNEHKMYDHSRISKKQQCSPNSNAKHLPVQEPSIKGFYPKVS